MRSTRREPSLELFADIVRNPAFREEDIDAHPRPVAGRHRAGKDRADRPRAAHVAAAAVTATDHPYAIPFTGSGTEAAIKALTADDLRKFIADYIRPDNAKIIVVGDTTLADDHAATRRRVRRLESARHEVPAKKNIADGESAAEAARVPDGRARLRSSR